MKFLLVTIDDVNCAFVPLFTFKQWGARGLPGGDPSGDKVGANVGWMYHAMRGRYFFSRRAVTSIRMPTIAVALP